jgi:hypothetical protein
VSFSSSSAIVVRAVVSDSQSSRSEKTSGGEGLDPPDNGGEGSMLVSSARTCRTALVASRSRVS